MKNFELRIQDFNQNKNLAISGLNVGEKTFLPYFLSLKKCVIVCLNKKDLDLYSETLKSLNKRVIYLEDKLPLLVTISERNAKEFSQYYKFVSRLAQGDYDVAIITPQVLFQKLPNKDYILSHTLTIKKGEKLSVFDIKKTLVNMGYINSDIVTNPGEFSLRGDVLDVYAIDSLDIIRVSFFDDEVEYIHSLDSTTYKTRQELDIVSICCNTFIDLTKEQKEDVKALIKQDLIKLNLKKSDSMVRISEIVNTQIDYLDNNLMSVSSVFFLPYLDYFNASIFDYLDAQTTIIFDEPKLITDKLAEIDEDNINSFLTLSLGGEFLPRNMDFYFKRDKLLSNIQDFKLVAYSRLLSQNKIFNPDFVLNFSCPHIKNYFDNYIDLVNDIKQFLDNGYNVAISARQDEVNKKLTTFLKDKGIDFRETGDLDFSQNSLILLKTGFNLSCYFELEKVVFIGDNNLSKTQLNTAKPVSSKPAYLPAVNDYVVHEVHGIGKCVGIKNLKITNVFRDYIIIEYRDHDLLYVPCENANMLSKYTAEGEVKCNKIGGAEFYKTKQKVKKSIKQMTFDLLKVYAERLNARGFRYSNDGYLQSEFEKAFPYTYTEDQIKAINDIKADMEGPRIMDRLLCGDVGFGKTEVALVSAYKAIQDGKQVAIICPTTILSEQHYATALSRMKNFLVNVQVINRFKTKKEQDKILNDLSIGKIDLIVGTHRLLSKDVKFKDLGLIIIDEEQRFGVEDKDKLKSIKKSVDVLSLSATPIPRTLYMSLVGIRDVSFLSTPPKMRKLIKTSVVDYSDTILVEACKRELSRGGQVLVVYNKVQSILNFYNHLKNLLPGINIDYAHGQMNSRSLEDAIYRLYSHSTQILVSTILIENGVDLPLANTLFVIDADKLGLSQLYQLRGRIGRSDIEAYAYFSFSKDKLLTVDSYKRLDAIMEFSNLGSGYQVALRDLQIRGAGDVLGRTQHGHMQQVGFDLYVKLLNEAVKEIKGEKIQDLRDIKINISINAYVPNDYISSNENRIEFYTKVSKISSIQQLKDLLANTQDRYGSLPNSVIELCYIGLIKNLGQNINASNITLNDFGTKIVLYEDMKDSPLIQNLKGGGVDYVLNLDKMPIIILKKQPDLIKSQEALINFLLKCSQIVNK